jgi:multidrug efflux pump subunit AcrA (membrane-fusion protein)
MNEPVTVDGRDVRDCLWDQCDLLQTDLSLVVMHKAVAEIDRLRAYAAKLTECQAEVERLRLKLARTDGEKTALRQWEIVSTDMIERRNETIATLRARIRELEGALQNLIDASSNVFADKDSGAFVRCENCGDQEEIWDMDFMPELGVAITEARTALRHTPGETG